MITAISKSDTMRIYKIAKKNYIGGYECFKKDFENANYKIEAKNFILIAKVTTNGAFVYFAYAKTIAAKKALYIALNSFCDVYFCSNQKELSKKHTDLGNMTFKMRKSRFWAE